MTQRAEARTAGYAYLSYIVFTMSSITLYSKAIAGNGPFQQLSSLSRMISTARVTVLLDLLQIVCALVLAATLYRITKGVDATLALVAMSFRLGEGLLGSLPLLGKLELMQLATAATANVGDATGYTLLENHIFNRPDQQFSEFCFVVGGFIFAYLFLHGRLIPRWLAWIGVAAVGAQMICVPLHIASFIPGSIVDRLWMLIMVYEIPLGLWLIIRGVDGSHGSPSSTAGPAYAQ
jgi:hypothetical protein